MTSINDFLDSVLSDFERFIRSGQDLCKLWDTHFDAGRIPDYSDINIQQLYLLRYAYAYAFEYKYMYSHLFERTMLPNSVEVTSIGCGSMVDYWSLERVIGNRSSIVYRGLDAIDWYYKFPIKATDSSTYICGDATDYFKRERLSSDIYIFPKSISEFSLTEIKTISDCFSFDRVTKDKIHFMFSLRTDRDSLGRDAQRTKTLFTTMLAHGFHTSDRLDQYYLFEKGIQGKTIQSVDSDFRHPGEIVDCIKDLYKFCPHIDSCMRKQGCESRLGRFPILKCNYARWQIFTFER